MSTLEQLNLLLPADQQNKLLLSAALAVSSRYSIISKHWGNYAELLAKERLEEMPLTDRLLDCVPGDGCSWLRDELWDNRESVFECAWGDTGEAWLQAIIGPPESDEARAVALHGAIEDMFETGNGLPAWSNRKPPTVQELVRFIRDWRTELLFRLARRVLLEGPTSPSSSA